MHAWLTESGETLISAHQDGYPQNSDWMAEAAEGGGSTLCVQLHHEWTYRKSSGIVDPATSPYQQRVVQNPECKASLLALVW